MKLQPFDYRGVTLDGGRLRQQVEEVRAAYLRIPNDDLLKPYRLRAGKPAPGADLKGVYIGHGTFGQHLSGLARLYAATGDVACKEKAEALLSGWADCMEPDGYALQAKPIDLAPYHVEKLVGGLVDMIAYCGDRGAAEPLLRLVAWSEANLAGTEKSINATDGNWYMLNGEWYTLAESFYRAYEVTRDARCLKLAKRFEYTDFWEIIRRRANPFDRPGWKGWYHAYSHVNSFCGAGPAYRVTGEARYLETLKAAYDFMQREETYATGGFGPGESLIARADLAASLERGSSHFETQCGSWAGFKLCKYLLAFTGDARYGDWAERLLLNGVGASIPMDPEGRVFYYSDYNLGGGVKKLISDGWPCCSGTRIELTADYHDLVFMHDDETLYAVQFAPATVAWKHRGARVQVRQQTRFPEEEATELTVQVARPREFGLAVRLPEWLAGEPKAWVNGKPLRLEAGSDHWGRARRLWRNGDTLRVSLPMSFRLSRIDPAREFPVAIMRGPVALAVRPTEGNPSREVDTKRLDATLKPVPGQPLNYRTGKDAALLVRPFSQFAAGEPYFLYLDPVRNFVRRSWEGYAFSGAWSDFGEWQTSASPGSTVQISFTGVGVRVHGFYYDDAGMFQVEIDGKVAGTLDEYGAVRGEKAHWDFAGLASGSHMLRLTVMEEKNTASKGRFCNLAYVEGLP
ncbi:MAG: glycoside hydrolase family 127 protein [Armatimonadetes bacterium]|nr:glycoside hydrolase family 127 protein [Armatimonadota bacterium]